MEQSEHTYTPPVVHPNASLPAQITAYFDGRELLEKTQAARLSSVDDAGWPHAMLLSAGDILVMPPDRIRLAIFPESTSAGNLARDKRLTMSMVFDAKMYELRFEVRELKQSSTITIPLAVYEAVVTSTRTHAAPYADLTSGVTFELHQPDAVLPRWQRQLEVLRHAG